MLCYMLFLYVTTGALHFRGDGVNEEIILGQYIV